MDDNWRKAGPKHFPVKSSPVKSSPVKSSPDRRQPKEIQNREEIISQIRDAVVEVTALFNNPDEVGINSGNGFFVAEGYIICPASLFLNPGPAPATIMGGVVSPPSVTILVTVARVVTGAPIIQLENSSKEILTKSDFSNTFSDSSSDKSRNADNTSSGDDGVSVGSHSYTYVATVVGIDGAANIGLLILRPQDNSTVPAIRSNHPYLHWGRSRDTRPGAEVFLLGNPGSASRRWCLPDLGASRAENAVSIGYISDNRYVDYGGSVPGELILVDGLPGTVNGGRPVLSAQGKLLGMEVGVPGDRCLVLSEYFIRRPLKRLVSALQHKAEAKRVNVDFVCPGTLHYSPPVGTGAPVPLLFHKASLCIGAAPVVDIDFFTDIVGTQDYHLVRKSCLTDIVSSYREIVGYRIIALGSVVGGEDRNLAMMSPENASSVNQCTTFSLPVPPGTSLPDYGPLTAGDIITHLNGFPLGDRKGQLAPALIMWRTKPGTALTVTYRRQVERFDLIHTISLTTVPYPTVWDVPVYSWPIHPLFYHTVPPII